MDQFVRELVREHVLVREREQNMNKNCVAFREQEQNENKKYFEHREQEQNKNKQNMRVLSSLILTPDVSKIKAPISVKVQTGSAGQNLMTLESMICNPATNFINWKPKNMLISHTLKHATKIHKKFHQVHVHLKSKIKLLDKYKLTFIIRQQNKSRLC